MENKNFDYDVLVSAALAYFNESKDKYRLAEDALRCDLAGMKFYDEPLRKKLQNKFLNKTSK